MQTKTKLKSKNSHAFRKFNQRKLKRINDLYIETHIAIEGLKSLQNAPNEMTTRKGRKVAFCINMPSTREGSRREITRNHEDLSKIIQQRISEKEFVQSIIVAVSLTEDYIAEVVRIVLQAYPKKLTASQKSGSGVSGEKKINISDLLDFSSLEEVIEAQVDKRVQDLLYASPKQYSEYLSNICGISIREKLVEEYAEVKATRDLYVHGDGKINELYVRKADQAARGQVGDKALVDAEYFDHTIRVAKEIFTTLFKGLRDKYHSDSKVERILERRGCNLN